MGERVSDPATVTAGGFPKGIAALRITWRLSARPARATVCAMRRLFLSVPLSVWVLAALCTAPEMVLLGADFGLWGSARWRPLAYAEAAFWAGLLHGWTPNYAGQPVTMFVTHSWLHQGPSHLAGNLAALFWLGPQLVARRGAAGLVLFWCVAVPAGGLAFGLIGASPAPMVGASGGLFGLAGEWVVAEVRAAAGRSARILRGVGLTALLVGLNGAAWVLQGGQLAWEAHLGGFLAGVGLAVLLPPDRGARPGQPAAA